MTWDEAKTRVEELMVWMEKSGDWDREDGTALRLLLSHAIPREDRERALGMAQEAIMAVNGAEFDRFWAEARRLLKLEAEP